MKRVKRIKPNKNIMETPTRKIVCTILVCTVADLALPAALDITCNLEEMKNNQACVQNVQEPIKITYSDFYTPITSVTTSGTATISTASSYGGLS